VKDSLADISRARTLLGYQPLVSFEDGIARTVAWYRSEAALAASSSRQPA
jgi:nucleoside-diphosphate-sugar epimerase